MLSGFSFIQGYVVHSNPFIGMESAISSTRGRRVALTREQAEQLRVFWKSQGKKDCDHPEIEKERYREGGHTGFYVCTVCGAYIGPEPEED